jgi:hypothetical protein
LPSWNNAIPEERSFSSLDSRDERVLS